MFDPPPPEVSRAAMRALVTVAHSDGPLSSTERDILGSVQENLLGTYFDIDDLDPIEAAALAEAVTDPKYRHCIVSGCALLGMIDGEIDSNEDEVVTTFARALLVSSPAVEAMKRYASHRIFALRLGLLRRYEPSLLVQKAWREKGPAGICRFVRQALATDRKVAARYQSLGELPEGTLGRAYYEFARGHGYPLPGEKGANPESVAFHDCIHVLTGYETTPAEEAKLSAFESGFHTSDPFTMLAFAIVQWHLEVKVCPLSPPAREQTVPSEVIAAFARGQQVPTDLFESFRPEEHFERPLADIRRDLGIPPLASA